MNKLLDYLFFTQPFRRWIVKFSIWLDNVNERIENRLFPLDYWVRRKGDDEA
jgi:hypothetical protein